MNSVFHIRLKDFELQAEQMVDRTLVEYPVAIISSANQNGTVVSLSREAEEEGFYPGMKVSLARKMSHHVKMLPFNERLYKKIHNYIYKLLKYYSPIIEPGNFGQYYLDMSGMQNIYKDATQAGYKIFRDINDRAAMKNRVGISVNKLVSHISTAVVNEPIYRVNKGNESGFLAPLQPNVLPALQDRRAEKIIRFLYLQKVQEIQKLTDDETAGRILFADNYRRIRQESHGEDHSIVQPPQLLDHIIRQTVLQEDTNDTEILDAVLVRLSEQLGYELRKRNQVAGKLSLEVHYSDGFKNTRTTSLPKNDNDTISVTCRNLFQKANYRRNRVRSIMIDACKFQPAVHQLSLFEKSKPDDISRTLDRLRDKYGFSCIKKAVELRIPDRTVPGKSNSHTGFSGFN
ncbi:MAG: hypothetical protein JXQ65_16200 [Candidatus Marinimicrobia bacterium]|nr:hypothetical protein [Candidatus Neomarinimicrobiota bacterium]